MEIDREKFSEKFRVDEKSGCWDWVGSKTESGYGLFRIGGKPFRAHRVSWELWRGAIPSGLQIDHRVCRNKLCVNPDHLVVCSLRENIFQPDGAVGKRSAQAACKRGHPLSGDNLYINIRGHRECRACRRAWEKTASKEGRRNATGRKRSVTFQCEVCGREFHPMRGVRPAGRYCSRACYYGRGGAG